MHAWQDFLNRQENLLGKETVDKWLRPLKIVHFDSANLYLEAKDSFQAMWFEEHIRPLLKNHLVNNNHRCIKVHLSVPEESLSSSKPTKKEKSRIQPPSIVLTPDTLDPNASIETFISGEANAILFRFFSELIDHQVALGAFNPIYVHGSPGTGKTHLLMALAQAFTKQGLSTLYVRSETFTEHVVSAIRSSEMQTFRKSYRTADILLVDDVHIFARRAATQEEFFHTFNALHTAGKQLILTANCAPPLLEEIEPRLISRFEWGIMLHLQRLGRAELKQVLESRCRALEFAVTDDVLNFIIESFPANPKSLNRALDTLVLRSHLTQNRQRQRPDQPIDCAVAKEYLTELIEAEKKIALSPQKVIATVAAFYGIRSEDILGKSHTQECALPRQVAMHLCRIQLDLSYMKIGQFFSRDHSTVMTSVKQIQSKLEQNDSSLSFAIAEIQRRLDTH